MSVVKFVLHQSRLANALFIILSVLGVAAWYFLPVEVYPKIRTSSAVVTAVWPGATAQEVEQFVTTKLEEQIQGVLHIDWYRSESTSNLARVVVRFKDEASESDVDSAFTTLQNRMRQIDDLPDGCELPIASRFRLDEDSPFLRICVYDEADAGPLVTRGIALRFKEELESLPGVAKVTPLGTGSPEVRVLLDRKSMEDAGLTVAEVAAVLQRSNVDVPIGAIKTSEQENPVRLVADQRSVEGLGGVLVGKSPVGAHVRLGDIGEIEEGLDQDFIRARYRGKPCVVLEVTKTSGSNILNVRDAVLARAEEFRAWPDSQGAAIEVAVDITPWVTNAMSVMQQNLLAGCVLVLIVLGVFLGIRNSLFAMLGIPFSFLCTLLCMMALDITLNTTSVFALVLVSGLIVDDAIVVLENVHRHMKTSRTRLDAIARGVSEVGPPVVAAALTTLAAFLPLVFVRGGVASLFADVPKLVGIALLASLFECLFILPSHILHWGKKTRAEAGGDARDSLHEASPGFLSRLGSSIVEAYVSLLGSVLRFRYLTVLLLIAMIILAASAASSLNFEPLPAEFPMAMVNFQSSPDTSLDETDRIAAAICKVLDELKEKGTDEAAEGDDGVVQSYISAVGMQMTDHQELMRQANLGMIWVQFTPTQIARRDPEAMLDVLRERIARLQSDTPDLDLESVSVIPMGTGLAADSSLAFRVGHADLAKCLAASRRLQERMAEIPGVTDVRDNVREGPLQVHVLPKEPACSDFALTAYDVAAALRTANNGVPAGNIRNAVYHEEQPIRVQLSGDGRSSLREMLALQVKSPLGATPRLEELAEPYYDQGFASLYRFNGVRVVTISASLQGARDEGGRPIGMPQVHQIVKKEFDRLKIEEPGLTFSVGGGYSSQQRTAGRMMIAALVAASLIYLILLVQFRSYVLPVFVLLTLLFGALGVIFGLRVHEHVLSIVTVVSLVGLFGVAVNDAIIFIDFINKAPRDENDRFGHLLDGGRLRLRPIVLTTLTTVVGLLPMAMGWCGYSSIWSPFAVCFSYGLTMATLLTLFVIPCFYAIHEDLGRLVGGSRASRAG